MFFYYCLIDEDEIYNNPNLHSEEQDELEIPDGKVFWFIKKTFTYFSLICIYFSFRWILNFFFSQIKLIYILQMKMKYIIIQIFIQKSKMNWKFLMVGSSENKLFNSFFTNLYLFIYFRWILNCFYERLTHVKRSPIDVRHLKPILR